MAKLPLKKSSSKKVTKIVPKPQKVAKEIEEASSNILKFVDTSGRTHEFDGKKITYCEPYKDIFIKLTVDGQTLLYMVEDAEAVKCLAHKVM